MDCVQPGLINNILSKVAAIRAPPCDKHVTSLKVLVEDITATLDHIRLNSINYSVGTRESFLGEINELTCHLNFVRAAAQKLTHPFVLTCLMPNQDS